jgi:hypothetical protein
MTTTVKIEVPKTAAWKVVVNTQSTKWDTETGTHRKDEKGNAIWFDDEGEQTYLPGVNGWVTLHDGKRISCVQEVLLTDTEKAELAALATPSGEAV